MTPPILSIVGRSNSGKTTLMERLIRRLSDQGLRIATIKHSHHQPELDQPGKDSWRHKQAGAGASFLIGPQQMLMVADHAQVPTPNLLASLYGTNFELVLVEGYSSLPGAKIEILRAARSSTLRCDPTELLAIVTDVEGLPPKPPQFALDDVTAIANFVREWMGRGC
ncbi:MAG: molybdopterin-guanine dinucleotide biosynthesis protein B [Mariprofundales bacterium]|nr:molybdopterin-guanine dinucleotide biosynthesis protein B [Mariprofundales bacterium]